MAQSAADRRRAQRRIARELQAERQKRGSYQRRAPGATAKARRTRAQYLADMYANPQKEAGLSVPEQHSLASAASYAHWGKAPAEYEGAWKKYWYHDA